jgi:hypothetical protein
MPSQQELDEAWDSFTSPDEVVRYHQYNLRPQSALGAYILVVYIGWADGDASEPEMSMFERQVDMAIATGLIVVISTR